MAPKILKLVSESTVITGKKRVTTGQPLTTAGVIGDM
jgi:hypothetical protein